MKNLIRNCLYLAVVSITVAGSVLSTSAAEEVSIAGFPNAVIKQPNAEYVESTIDLQVKVLGGDVALNRTWANGRWHVNPNWASLRFVADPLGQSIQSVDRSGAIYKRTGDAGIYQFEQYYLQKIASGWRWYDVQGNWIHYDDQGRITEYGDRNDITVHFIRDAEGRLTNINDHNGQLVYQFTYDAQERLTNVRDRANRMVTYQWTGDLLTKVTDVLGNDWTYGYNKDGQLNERYEPDGGVIKVEYDVSVPAGKLAMVSGKNTTSQSSSEVTLGSTPRDFKPARVGKIINKTGAVTLVNTRYDNVKKTYLITVTDPMGKQTETLSNSQGHLLSQKVNGVLQSKVEYEGKYRRLYTDARGLTTTIDYSTTQKPVKVLYADGTSETYEYSSHYDLLTRYVNAKGITTAFSYDAKGNLTQSIEAVGTPVERKVTYQYDHYGQLVEVTLGEDQNQRTLIQKYDVNGNKIQLVDSKGNAYQFTADVMGNITSATNPLSANWSYQYNLAGHLTEVKNPLNQQEQYQVDFAGRITNYQDPLQHNTQLAYSFDTVGTQRSITNALGETNKDHYNLVGNLIQTQSPTGLVDEQRYNLDGRLNQVIDAMGNITALTYGTTDAMTGMLAEVKYPTYRETYGYNEKGQVTSVTQWLDDTEKQTTLMSYDELGQLVAEVLPGNRTTQIIYDELGNTVQQTDAMGGITSQKWNIFGELVEVTNANGHTHRFTYDANSNLIEENNPSSGITQYEYDAANQLIKKVNAKGDQTTYQYDLAGKLTTEITTATGSATPSQIVTYLYNDAGQLVDVKQTGSTNSRYQYSMDALGRTTEETVTYGTGGEAITKKLGYGYDQENRLSSFQYPEGSELQYHYDKANLKSTQLANGESIEWKNYQWFSPTEINTPNVKQQNQYDALMRPTTISVSNQQNTALMKRDYQYNVAGNIISRNTEKGKVDYRYDQLDRLIEATPDTSLQAIGLPNEGYTYDAIGNRLGSRHQPGSWQYNGQDQLMSWGTGSQAETLSYTATGQLKQNKKTLETLDYDYDATDRLTEVKRNDITLANYQYDPFGRRMSKEVNGERTYFLYSDEGLIAELNDRGNTQVAYGWLPDSTWGTNPLWQANLATGQTLKNAAYHYLHTDHLGTPQIATNQAGNITWQAEAEVFGETHLNESNQITMNLRFPGQYYDAETDTHYNYFRDYNPRTGRYQQSDPIGLGGGMNNYVYPLNPNQTMDPLGLKQNSGRSCDEIADAINDLVHRNKRTPESNGGTHGLEYRFPEQIYGSYGPGMKKIDPKTGNIKYPWDTHTSEIKKDQKRLRDNLAEWDDNGCGGQGGKKITGSARYWAYKTAPRDDEWKGNKMCPVTPINMSGQDSFKLTPRDNWRATRAIFGAVPRLLRSFPIIMVDPCLTGQISCGKDPMEQFSI